MITHPQDEIGGETAAVNQVLDSQTFATTPSLRSLLLYLWRSRDQTISEYAIATEALGRQASFDAKIDATVRVQISRLRQRLEKFYGGEGRSHSQRLSIPLGTHRVQLTQLPCDVPAPVIETEVYVPAYSIRPRRRALQMLIAFLSLLCLAEGIGWKRSHRVQSANVTPNLSWFWKTFLSNGLPTRVILPTPTFLSFALPGNPGHSLMLRDTEVNTFESAINTPLAQRLAHPFHAPTLAENYTVTSDTFASIRLVRYLDSQGVHSTVARSVDAPLEALDRENVIAIGTWGTRNFAEQQTELEGSASSFQGG